MKRFLQFVLALIIFTTLGQAAAQTDDIYAIVDGNTATIHHDATERNCGSIFVMDVQTVDNLITVTEVDTGMLAYCICIFDLSVTIGPLDPGTYAVDIYSTDAPDGYCWGSTEFTVGGAQLLDQFESDCQAARDDSSSIEIDVQGDNMTLIWETPMINCCIIPEWGGDLQADTFYVTMTDVGPPCDCICPFTLSATFGPFDPGTYTLDFWNGYYGYPSFTISESAARDSNLVVDQYQSDCYHIVDIEDTEPGAQSLVDFSLYPAEPNPFNQSTTIGFHLTESTTVSLRVFDISGRLINRLIDEKSRSAGEHKIRWDGTNSQGERVGSGVYVYQLQTRDQVESKRMILMK
ncbi:MAG: hypothetical protein B6244_02580 [Candidatus Cloacimonetes bacterium 4572_55]|nr:MAG: hypothetical protein B6244_02580 [Candidatus Cloacimonetes bacterium 4572_55]